MYKLFSDRNKKLSDEVDIYIYDNLPTPFRNQLFFIIEEVIVKFNKHLDSVLSYSDRIDLWETTHNLFCREKGIKEMDSRSIYYRSKIENFIDEASDADVLDFIDLAFSYLSYISRKIQLYDSWRDTDKTIKDAIGELNERFQQHRLGYEFVNEALIRIDDIVIHSEYVKPALNLLHGNGFEGAEEEYTKAFEALRKRDYKSSIIEAEKAFESTVKVICEKKGYQYNPEKDAARKLLNVLKTNQYFPSYMESHLDAIVSTLENGAPVVRNKTAGHGQGKEIIDIPDTYAKYVIGLVAVNIVFLVQLLSE